MTPSDTEPLDIERAVSERYSAAAEAAEPALCCAVKYDARYLEVLPEELIERDYGCGDPARYVRSGETVLDLGSGGGKICYIASQIVGPQGRVIGVDMNDDMLALARKYRQEIGQRIGWQNVEFHKGRIQDLALDLERFEQVLRAEPIADLSGWLAAHRRAESLRSQHPMIPDDSIDVVLSNCVLNLVQPADRHQLFAELFRVLKPGGRAVISDIVSSAEVPPHLQQDPKLWSGCISGAFEELAFARAFEQAGFGGLEIVERQSAPWTVVEEIEFRSVTVQAYKPVPAPRGAQPGVVIYRGPWRSVVDDGGIELRRGEPTEVPAATRHQLAREPFASHVWVGNRADSPASLTLVSGTSCCGPDRCC
jgi:arsenite methyltransferase